MHGVWILKDPQAHLDNPTTLRTLRETAQEFAGSMRTLVLVGREDPAVTPAQADFMAAHIHGAEFKIVDEASQLAAIEKPLEVARLVCDFLSRTGSLS